MRLSLVLCILLIMSAVEGRADVQFDRYFSDATIRVDYYHTGTKGEERFSMDRVYREGPWPGSRTRLLDTLNLGEFLVRVYDQATNVLLYSRGFSSMFQEWQTTDEAATGAYRTFEETVRFPYPRRTVQVTIARRDKRMVFHDLFSLTVDPGDPTVVIKDKPAAVFPLVPLMSNGPSAEKVDILILGDGYAKDEMEKFRKDAAHFNSVMFSTNPFSKHKKGFNVWTIEVQSDESGIDVPDKNVWKRNALGSQYNTFGSARYVLIADNRRLRDIAASAPYDYLCILVNDTRYGGGGIFNLYATTYTKEQTESQRWQMDYVYVHEFGHSFAGLGDEYYGSSTAYNEFYPAGIEPWEPNITALLDKKNVKWKVLVSAGTELPTYWGKVRYDSLEAERGKLDRLAPDYYAKREPLMKAEEEILKRPDGEWKVGAFEGAGYVAKGLYRPSIDCRMFSLSTVGFDPVCSAAIERVVEMYTK
jgi:hypothetical protein